MVTWIVKKLKTGSLWHLVWVTVIMVEILTAVMNTINSYIWYGRWSPELMKIGTVDAFVVGVIAASVVVLIFDRLRSSEKAAENEVRELNRELERRVATRTTELSASEEKYRMFLEQATDGIVVAAQDRRLLMVNPKACELSGYTREEIMSMKIDDFLTPEGLVAFAGDFKDLLSGKTLFTEYQIRRKDSMLFTSEISATMLSDGTLHAIFRDVTTRKEADEALRESELKFRKLVEGSLAGVYILQEGVIVYSNPELERIFGYQTGEFKGKNVLDLIHTDDIGLAVASMSSIISGESPTARARLRAYRVDGSEIYVDVMGAATVYDGKPSIIGMLQDVSELIKAEHEKELMQQQVVKAQKMGAVGRLAGGIAHDFNNLLTVIRGDCELALADVRGDDPARFSLNQIRKASVRASELTRKLMLFGRQMPIAPVRLDLNAVVADMLQMLARVIGEDITVTVEPVSGLMPVLADKAGVEQVIMNLVLNARDAMPDGGTLTIRIENANGQPRPGTFVRLSVSDTGCGIEREAIPYLFDPFYTGKEIGKGTGLGLSTAYGIVEQHGGWITVESEPGKGSTFSVYLEAGERAGMPKGLVACMSKVSLKGTQELMQHKYTSLILATGGSEMVKAAHSVGKPAYGVGPGNVP